MFSNRIPFHNKGEPGLFPLYSLCISGRSPLNTVGAPFRTKSEVVGLVTVKVTNQTVNLSQTTRVLGTWGSTELNVHVPAFTKPVDVGHGQLHTAVEVEFDRVSVGSTAVFIDIDGNFTFAVSTSKL
jgi:hypothetical protein